MGQDEDAGVPRLNCPAAPEELALNDRMEGDLCPLTGSIVCALTETRETVIRLEGKVNTQGEDMAELKMEVFGNGKPGLKTEMIKLRMVMSGVKWAAGILGGAILIDVAVRLIQVLAPHAPAVAETATKATGGG